MSEYNFNIANPYQMQQEELARRQKMAEVLQQQSFQPMERNSYNGIEAPISPYAGLAKMLQAYTASKMQGNIARERMALGEKYKTESSDILQKAFQAGQGTPAVPETQVPESNFMPTGMDLSDKNLSRIPEGQPNAGNIIQPASTIPGQPAIAPNQEKMAQLLMTSPNPTHEALGLQTLQKAMEAKRTAAVLANMGVGAAQATPAQALSAEAVMGGAPGPTNAASGRIGTPNAGIPGVSPQAIALMLDSSSHLNDIGKAAQTAFAKQSEPIASRENAPIVQFNPKTGTYEVVFQGQPKLGEGQRYDYNTNTVGVTPGYLTTSETIGQSKANIESQNKIITVKIGGRDVTGTEAQIKAMLTGNAPDSQTAQDAMAIATDNKIPVNIRVNPTGAVNPTEGEKTYAVKSAEQYADLSKTYRDSWSNAGRMNGMLDTLDQLYKDPNVTSGGLADNITGLKGIAASLNINIAGKSSEDAIKSITNRFALELRNPSGGAGMPGSMSDSDRNFLSSIPPTLSNTPAGRELISYTMRAVNNRDKQIANLAQLYEEKNGRLDTKFVTEMRKWSDANPIMDAQQKAIIQALIKKGNK
jgi:hypothetical protein